MRSPPTYSGGLPYRELAQRQLFGTTDSVGAIADRLGYSSSHRLSNKFKQETGLMPARYWEFNRPLPADERTKQVAPAPCFSNLLKSMKPLAFLLLGTPMLSSCDHMPNATATGAAAAVEPDGMDHAMMHHAQLPTPLC